MPDPKPVPISQSTIDEVRARTSLVDLVRRRVALRRSGAGWKGLCPFHKEGNPSFHVSDARGFYHCFGCGAHGDAFEWVQEVDGCDFREAAVRLAAAAGIALFDGQGGSARPSGESAALDGRKAAEVAQRESVRPGDGAFVSSATAGRWIWGNSGPARGEIVERYLESRGLDPFAVFDQPPGTPPQSLCGGPANQPLPAAAIDQLRFHPRCPVGVWRVHEHPEDHWLTAPAMVAPMADADGAVRGVHVTYLAPDGCGKARFPRRGDGSERPTRKMFGKVAGMAVCLSSHPSAGETTVRGTVGPGVERAGCAVALSGDPSPRSPGGESPSPSRGEGLPLIVGEGIETVWAFAQGHPVPSLVFATLSLENLQGGAVKLRDGSLPLWHIQADPERPPFVIPDVAELVLLVDADMKPLKGQKVQRGRGERPVRADIHGLQRAEICAALAAQHWRRAGAAKVTVLRPRMGNDFNDALKATIEGVPAMRAVRGTDRETVGSSGRAAAA